jgi:hypothetical protein
VGLRIVVVVGRSVFAVLESPPSLKRFPFRPPSKRQRVRLQRIAAVW